jgi:hypothetical protein
MSAAVNMAPTKERPIVLRAPEVRLIIAGNKTQMRHVVLKPERYADLRGCADLCPLGQPGDRLWVKETWYCDHFAAGDFEYTKNHTYVGKVLTEQECIEEWRGAAIEDGGWTDVYYRAEAVKTGTICELIPECTCEGRSPWISAVNMPRWASRLVLEITEVRVQTLHEIGNGDSVAEGLAIKSKDGGRTWKYGIADRDGLPGTDDTGWAWQNWDVEPRRAFQRLWDQNLTRYRRAPWVNNPWVWAISFRRLEP